MDRPLRPAWPSTLALLRRRPGDPDDLPERVARRPRWTGATRLDRRLALGLMLSLAGAGQASAAVELKPPSKALTGGNDRVAVLTVVEKTADSKIVFDTVETLYGDSDPRVTVRVEVQIYPEVEVGTSYVVGFSNVRRNARFAEIREIDPEGFRVVGVLGAGPALFEDRPHVRLLFAGEVAESPPPVDVRVAAILSTMESRDPRTRALGVLELSLRPEWYPSMSAQDVSELRRLLRQRDLATDLRHYVLDTARRLPAPVGPPDWLGKEARRAVAGMSAVFDLTSFEPRLAITAIEILEKVGRRSDGRRLARFLGSNNPAVVRAALQTVDRYRPDLARRQAAELLERRDLHPESRKALRAYLESAAAQ